MNKTNAGITLVELCLVGVILSGIFIVSWPVLNQIVRQNQLELVCKNIAVTFNFLREHAIVEGRHYSASFDKTRKTLDIKFEYDPVAKPGEFSVYSSSRLKNIYWPDDIEIKEISDKQIVFNPDGTANSFTVTLENLRKDACTLSIQGVSGKCKIENKK